MLTLHYCRQSFGFFTHWKRDLGSSMFYHFFLFSTPIKTGFCSSVSVTKESSCFSLQRYTCTCVMMKQISSSLLVQDEFMALWYCNYYTWYFVDITVIFFFDLQIPCKQLFFSSPCICFIIMLMPVLGYFWE